MELSPGWGLYLAGQFLDDLEDASGATQEVLLKSDLKFAEVVADLFGSLRQARALQAAWRAAGDTA